MSTPLSMKKAEKQTHFENTRSIYQKCISSMTQNGFKSMQLHLTECNWFSIQ